MLLFLVRTYNTAQHTDWAEAPAAVALCHVSLWHKAWATYVKEVLETAV